MMLQGDLLNQPGSEGYCGVGEAGTSSKYRCGTVSRSSSLNSNSSASTEVAGYTTSCCPMERNGIIKLNVGGKKFLTSKHTILGSNSMLARMFDEDNAAFSRVVDAEGYAFIDRDGERFGHILNFLRCHSLPSFDCSWRYEEVLEEADFFAIEELAEHCQEKIRAIEAAKEREESIHKSYNNCNYRLVEPLASGKGGVQEAGTGGGGAGAGAGLAGVAGGGGGGQGGAAAAVAAEDGAGDDGLSLEQRSLAAQSTFTFTLDEDF